MFGFTNASELTSACNVVYQSREKLDKHFTKFCPNSSENRLQSKETVLNDRTEQFLQRKKASEEEGCEPFIETTKMIAKTHQHIRKLNNEIERDKERLQALFESIAVEEPPNVKNVEKEPHDELELLIQAKEKENSLLRQKLEAKRQTQFLQPKVENLRPAIQERIKVLERSEDESDVSLPVLRSGVSYYETDSGPVKLHQKSKPERNLKKAQSFTAEKPIDLPVIQPPTFDDFVKDGLMVNQKREEGLTAEERMLARLQYDEIDQFRKLQRLDPNGSLYKTAAREYQQIVEKNRKMKDILNEQSLRKLQLEFHYSQNMLNRNFENAIYIDSQKRKIIDLHLKSKMNKQRLHINMQANNYPSMCDPYEIREESASSFSETERPIRQQAHTSRQEVLESNDEIPQTAPTKEFNACLFWEILSPAKPDRTSYAISVALTASQKLVAPVKFVKNRFEPKVAFAGGNSYKLGQYENFSCKKADTDLLLIFELLQKTDSGNKSYAWSVIDLCNEKLGVKTGFWKLPVCALPVQPLVLKHNVRQLPKIEPIQFIYLQLSRSAKEALPSPASESEYEIPEIHRAYNIQKFSDPAL